MARLLVYDSSDQTTKSYPLNKEQVVVGRQPGCDVVLNNAAVSREHARIFKTEAGWAIEDLRSLNGVWVGGRRVESKPELLRDKDVVSIGKEKLEFLDDYCDCGTSASSSQMDRLFWREGEQDLESIVSQVLVKPQSSSVDLAPCGRRARAAREAAYKREIALLEERLRVMLEFARNLGKAENFVDLAPRFLKNLLRLFPNADSACILEPTSDESDPNRMAWRLVNFVRRDETNVEAFHVSRAIIKHVVTTKAAALSNSAFDDSRFSSSESVVLSKIRSVMAAPIYDVANDRLFGVIQVDSRGAGRPFEPDELKMLVAVANQIAVYWENQYYRDAIIQKKLAFQEMQVANEIQRGFLPAEPPKIDNYEFFDYYKPAKFVGGDYFDYVPLPNGSIAILLGDVAGKGVAASLLMAKLSSEVHYGLALEKQYSAAVKRLNRVFTENHWGDRFITLALVILEPSTGVLRIFNAGHLYPIVSKADGSVEEIGEGFNSFPIGIEPDAEFPEFVYHLQEGDAVALMSDGLPDAMSDDEEAFGNKRILEALRNEDSADAEQIGRRLIEAAQRFANAGRQTDDQCLVVFRRRKASTDLSCLEQTKQEKRDS